MRFDPRPICAILNEEGVRYVLIGGFAAAIHGSPLPTSDVDIVPSREHDNLERLARALNRLHRAFGLKPDRSTFASTPNS